MKKFIAYFDYLGFKDFIEYNSLKTQKEIMENNFCDIELALSKGKTKRTNQGTPLADISNSKINCINFSDTVVFWTNDNTIESFNELLHVAYEYNISSIIRHFPTRGSIIYGELEHVDFRQESNSGGKYNLNSLYGAGIIKAYKKTESQKWAGCVIDNSVIEIIGKTSEILTKYAVKYNVPYKKCNIQEEYVLLLWGDKLNEERFINLKKDIEINFTRYHKSIDKKGVKNKLLNTIEFLSSLKE